MLGATVKRDNFILFFMLILVIIISIITTYFWMTYHSAEFYFKQNQSVNIVKIPNSVLYSINGWYGDVFVEEKALCLNGYKTNDVVYVTGYYEPELVKTTQDSVLFVSCRGIMNIGTIHMQSEGTCELSREDVYAFGKTNDLIMGVICGQDQFRFYTPQDLNFGFGPAIT